MLDKPALDRQQTIQRAHDRTQPWDVIVIGGGATGLGAALDSVTRGLDTLLLEGHDFAKGTSSRSTKLIHGGVRYLPQGNVSLVRSALKERRRLLELAPHLVHQREFVIPTKGWFERPYYWLGLKAYDGLAGKDPLPSSEWLSHGELSRRLPALQTDNLSGGVAYWDGQFDDARLAIHLARTVRKHDGELLNYFPVNDVSPQPDGSFVVAAQNQETGESHEFPTKAVINAAGIFGDEVRRMENPDAESTLTFSRGSHLVIDPEALALDRALLVPETADERVLFAIPWHGKSLVGTTDVPCDDPTEEPQPTDEEITYLLDHLNMYLQTSVDRSDIQATFAGLRGLVSDSADDTSKVSRDHQIRVSESGMVSAMGGKWTTYRLVGQDAVNRVAEQLELDVPESCTDELPIHGAQPVNEPGPMTVFGRDRGAIDQLADELPRGDEPLHPDLPYPKAIVPWSIRHEMARTVEDILARRTRSLLMDAKAAEELAEPVAEAIAKQVDHDEDWIQSQIQDFQQLARRYQA